MTTRWPTKALGDVLQLEYGKPLDAAGRKPDGLYPVYGANGEKDRSDTFYCNEPSIIVGRKGSAGEVTLTEGRFWPLDVTYFVKFDKQSYDLRFLFYLLGNLELPKLAKGVKPGINRNEVYGLPVKTPPLAEQRRIVGILDEAFDGIATAKANAEKNARNARAIFESYLENVIATNADGWNQHLIGDEGLLKIVDGDRGVNYPKATDFSDNGHCLFLNTKNVRPDGFNFQSLMFVTSQKDKELRKGKLDRGDVVLTTRGTIGNIGLYADDILFEHIRINSGMLILRANKKRVRPEFLFEIMRSGIMKKQIKENTTGAAQPQLPIKTLVQFNIPVPISLEHQIELVAKIRDLESETTKLVSIYEKKIAALDELKKSLLHQAFSGNL